jgi:hypothetical protein
MHITEIKRNAFISYYKTYRMPGYVTDVGIKQAIVRFLKSFKNPGELSNTYEQTAKSKVASEIDEKPFFDRKLMVDWLKT